MDSCAGDGGANERHSIQSLFTDCGHVTLNAERRNGETDQWTNTSNAGRFELSSLKLAAFDIWSQKQVNFSPIHRRDDKVTS